MRTVGAGEGRRSLSRLLDAVERGQTVTITRYGRPVARIEPVRSSAVAETIRELIDEGRM